MDTEALKSLAELGYAFILIAWLMTSHKDLKQRLRDTQDRYVSHLEKDIEVLRDDDNKKED